jgi:polyketide synthase PksL
LAVSSRHLRWKILGTWPRFIEIQNKAGINREISLAEKASLIWDEIYEKDWTAQEIRYRGNVEPDQTYARYISELALQTDVEKKLSTLSPRQNGVYLITGGSGGLGYIFAQHLAKNYQAKLVLLGRSVPNPAQQEKLHRLKEYGAETLVLQADVSRLEDMERVVREARARFSAIHGVIHAAGVNRDSFILNKTKAEMEVVLASKVYGTINLDLATSSENLDFFVLFSSIAGVMGNLGKAITPMGTISWILSRKLEKASGVQRGGRAKHYPSIGRCGKKGA